MRNAREHDLIFPWCNVIPEMKRGDNSQLSYRNSILHSLALKLSLAFHRLLGPGARYQANGDVLPDGVLFLIELLEWGRAFSDFCSKTVIHI